MSNIIQLVEDEQTSEFYPTPPSLVEKMLEGIDWSYIHTILEPSAGKGDILREVAKAYRRKLSYYESPNVDCIEIDPNLRQILKYNFSEERKDIIDSRNRELKPKTYWNEETRRYVTIDLTESQAAEKQEVQNELKTFFAHGIHIVHDNFLTYKPFKHYDLIIMNPPFSNGDKHLLKALKMQEKGGGVICLLNAETIRNPYTESRRELAELLREHNAQIEYIENAFVSAERKTGVEVALVKVFIEEVQEESEIYDRLKKAEKYEDDFDPTVTDIEVTDYIKATVNMFNLEVKAGIELIRQYKALVPYMAHSFGDEWYSKSPILELKCNDHSVKVNDYIERVRHKYWRALLGNPKFIGKLTGKLQTEHQKNIDKLKDYDFTEFNIRTLYAELNAKVRRGIEEEIIAMFDRLTEEHSWYPECSKNRHYYDGWKTNIAHKIDKKVIVPCYGVFDSYDGKPRTYEAKHILEDIERILNFLDGGKTEEVDSWTRLKIYFENYYTTKKIPLKYFTVTFYKKGTVHIEFTCPELIERFNIYAAQNKKWLPPNYGKAKYTEMTEEEKAVIDSFQGEAAYNEVLRNSGYYLAPVTNGQMLMLGSGE